jgi:hypothetical protein
MSVKPGIFYIIINIYIYIDILKRLVATHKPGRTVRSMMNHADLTKDSTTNNVDLYPRWGYDSINPYIYRL